MLNNFGLHAGGRLVLAIQDNIRNQHIYHVWKLNPFSSVAIIGTYTILLYYTIYIHTPEYILTKNIIKRSHASTPDRRKASSPPPTCAISRKAFLREKGPPRLKNPTKAPASLARPTARRSRVTPLLCSPLECRDKKQYGRPRRGKFVSIFSA